MLEAEGRARVAAPGALVEQGAAVHDLSPAALVDQRDSEGRQELRPIKLLPHATDAEGEGVVVGVESVWDTEGEEHLL